MIAIRVVVTLVLVLPLWHAWIVAKHQPWGARPILRSRSGPPKRRSHACHVVLLLRLLCFVVRLL